jgi:hypothetical protein
MPFYEHGDLGVEAYLVSTTWCPPRLQCLDERILGKFAVLVVFVGRAAALDSPCNAVGVAELAARHPHPAAEVLAGDLAVLPDPKRRSAGHAVPI